MAEAKLKPNACKHSKHGHCVKCVELDPYLVFRTCKDRCFDCNECGYVWGPKHSLSGKKPNWSEIK